MQNAKKKVSYVTYKGRTIVDTNALLQDPKVRAVVARLTRDRDLAGAGSADTKTSKSR
jgi:hypothetical protein